WYEIRIKTSTFQIRHEFRKRLGETSYGKNQISVGTLPRFYLGAFDTIRSGTAPACRLNVDGTCNGPREPLGKWIEPRTREINDSWGISYHDTPVVYGGIPDLGACCLDNGTCQDNGGAGITLGACQALGGRFSGGRCATVLCCPLPFADADTDGDVDQADFGAFQVCYNGSGAVPTGCACYDRNGDNKVDGTDFTAFNNCWTGPNVPFNKTSPPSGCNP
ncbi:MAG TPA: hypothetical protein VLM89_16465, partial [Phycisphaerae bacterium]|nr:hypothetical protein [Phycisphaerae bacterium]